MLRWEDERYTRLYTRDTVAWRMLPWQARCLLPLLMRKLDRAGLLELGEYGAAGLAVLVDVPPEVVELGLAALLKAGTLTLSDTGWLLMPNYLAAQEARASDKARQAKGRELARDTARKDALLDELSRNVTGPSQNVTESHALSHGVTSGHTASQPVTPSLAVPSLAVPRTTAAASAADAPAGHLALGPIEAMSALRLQAEAKPDRRKADPPPRLKALTERLVASYAKATGCKYGHRGAADTNAVKVLMGFDEDDAEVARRWESALRATGWAHVSSLAELPAKWNHHRPGQASLGPLPPSDFSECDPSDTSF